MIIYELLLHKQPQIIKELMELGMIKRPAKAKSNESLTHSDYAKMMNHNKWKRHRGAIRQVQGRVFK